MALTRRFFVLWAEDGWREARLSLGRFLRQHREGSAHRSYATWLRQRQRQRRSLPPPSGPMFSIIVPVYKPNQDHLEACIKSVRRQTYRRWQLILVDDGSHDPAVIRRLRRAARRDARIRAVVLPENSGIAQATNQGLEHATGDFVSLLDHDDLLTPDALSLVAQWLAGYPDADLVYGDEDKLDSRGRPTEPWFRADQNMDLLWAYNTMAHPVAIRTSRLRSIGGIRVGFEGAQDYDLILRLVDAGARVVHVPEVLYHWRVSSTSTAGSPAAKPHTWDAGRDALAASVERRGVAAVVRHGTVPNHYEVVYTPRRDVRVGVVVTTASHPMEVLSRLRYLVDAREPAPQVTVTIVYPSLGASHDGRVAWPQEWVGIEGKVVAFVGWPNTAAMLNYGASRAPKCDVLLFVGDDVTIPGSAVLHQLVGSLMRPGVGVVGGAEIGADSRIRQCGIHLAGAEPLYSFEGVRRDDVMPHDLSRCARETTAVSASVMATTWEAFTQVGGFSERLPETYFDVAYCVRVRRELGLRVIIDPTFPVLKHGVGRLTNGRPAPSDYERLAFLDFARRARLEDFDAHLPHGDTRRTRSVADIDGHGARRSR